MSTQETTGASCEAFRREIYDYYEQHGRSFPWRRTDDPYEILVSEFMLQQTPTGRVKGKYGSFLSQFPTCAALTNARMREVLEVWQGLGYNRRAQWLQRCAVRIVNEHDGRVPRRYDELIDLPGVGPATAGGVLAFAFDVPTVFLETNIRRALIYFFFPGEDKVEDEQLRSVLADALDRRKPRRWYYALMDYGAMLKESHPTLHRRSARYRRQGAFEGSDRQIRGAIIKVLLSRRDITAEALAEQFEAEDGRVRRVLSDLTEEGMVREDSGRYNLP